MHHHLLNEDKIDSPGILERRDVFSSDVSKIPETYRPDD